MTDALTNEELTFLDEIALDTIEPVNPPSFVRARVLELITHLPQEEEDGVRYIRASEGEWRPVPMLRGIDFKKLSSDRKRNTVTLLMRFQPGAKLPAHVNKGDEDAYVISGSCTVGGIDAWPGDYQHITTATKHPEIIAKEDGCLVLLVVDRADYEAA